MKAIETEYNGYLFRSRIEARWAVFFKSLNVKYEYEHEGYYLGDKMYLPDFYLPDHQVYFEIKGVEPNKEEMEKAYLLSKESAKPVILAYGGFYIDTSIDYLTKASPECLVFWGDADQWWDHCFSNTGSKVINKGFSFFCESRMISLINFLRSKNLDVKYEGTSKSWKQVIDKDKEYLHIKYGKEHPSYKYGIVDKELCISDISKNIELSTYHDFNFNDKVIRAYRQASKARFGRSL